MNIERLFRLDGRVALVTGASSGLGARFAEVCAAQGAKVTLVARRTDRLMSLKQRIEAAGGSVLAVAADVTDEDAVTRAFEATERELGVVDLFVANAGVAHFETPLEATRTRWREILSTNLDAVFFGALEAARRMIAAGKPGGIITISSVAGFRVPGRLASYGIAKAAVIQATRQLALELGPKGIRVNGIAPGWIMTEMSQEYLSTQQGQTFTSQNPLGRFGQPDDLDGVFLLLASDAGRLITGQTIVVDAGQMLR